MNSNDAATNGRVEGDEKSVYENDIRDMCDENTPPSKLRRLFYKHFNTNMFDVSLAVMDQEKCPLDIMEHIAKYATGDTRYLMLGGSRLPSINAIHILLENDGSEECRLKIFDGLTDRSDLSTKFAKELQKSRHEVLRLVAISNPFMTSRVIWKNAASDVSDSVRLACARHTECPSSILDQLGLDRDPIVRSEAIANSNLKRSFIFKHYNVEMDLKVRLKYLERDDCPVKVIEYYFDGADESIKKAMAGNNRCPQKILRELAKDASKDVRLNVVLNRNTPTKSIDALTMDSVPTVRSAAGFHANRPEGRLQHAFIVPNVTYPSQNNNANLLTRIQSINDCYSKCITECNERVEDLISRHEKVRNISLAWDFEYFLAPPNYVDRTRGMLAGPFYTSQKYPWPRNKENKLAEPIIQIDLDEVSHVRGKSYGTGLLQVFADGIDLVTRHIHRPDVRAEGLTECEWEFFEGDDHSFYQFVESPNHQIVIRQIAGYKEPYISSAVDSHEGTGDDLPPDFWKLNEHLKEVADSSGGNHLFGTFYEIQTSPCDGELFVALDEADGYVWGDTGNAQIFVKEDEQGFKYSAQWSCY